MAKKTYQVERRIKHDGKIVTPGVTIELSEDHAAAHLASGALSHPKKKPPVVPVSEVDPAVIKLKAKVATDLASALAKLDDKQLAGELADAKKAKKAADIILAIETELARRKPKEPKA